MKKESISGFLRGWIVPIVLASLLATSVKSAIADCNVVPTGSMKPTIVEGDRIFVNKLAYDLKVPYTSWRLASWSDPKRGDIVVFYSPLDGGRLVKRIVGLPGDTIEMKKNRLFINQTPAQYELLSPDSKDITLPGNLSGDFVFYEKFADLKHLLMITPHQLSPNTFGPIVVPEAHYFMMGDNRDNSADSRYFGFVDRNLIAGQATAVVASFNPDRYYMPRLKRFFTKLN